MYKSSGKRLQSAQKGLYRRAQNTYAPSSSQYSNVMSPCRVSNYMGNTISYQNYPSNDYTRTHASSHQKYRTQAAPYNAHRNRQAPLEHDKILTQIFQIVATEESLIEQKRIQLATKSDFVAQDVFQTIISEEGQTSINAYQLLEFLSNNNLQAEMADAQDIIEEFDCKSDKTLDEDEFLQIILPADNPNVRQLALNRGRNSRDGKAWKNIKLPSHVLREILNIIEKEISLQRQRNARKRQLQKLHDFSARKAFQKISRNYQSIRMPDLIVYLKQNGFSTGREEIEAIVRRCDHDGNQMISFEEFQELISVGEILSENSDDFAREETQQYRTPQKNYYQQTIQQDKYRSQSSSKAVFREDMNEVANRQARREAEQAHESKRQQLEANNRNKYQEDVTSVAQTQAQRKIQEENERHEKQKRQVYHIMFLRFVKYLFETHWQNEEDLDAKMLFDKIDDRKRGSISSSHLRRWIIDNFKSNIPKEDITVLQKAIDIDDDYKITKEEFIQSVGWSDSSDINNHEQQNDLCPEEKYVKKLESQLKIQDCDYEKYLAGIRQFGNIENLTINHLLRIKDNIKLDKEQYDTRDTAQWLFYNQYYSVSKLNTVAWLLCKHKSDEIKQQKLDALIDPSLSGKREDAYQFEKEFLYISLNFNEKIVRSQPDSAEKKAALSYLKELRKNSQLWQMKVGQGDFKHHWTQSGIRQAIQREIDEKKRKEIEKKKEDEEYEKYLKECKEKGIVPVQKMVTEVYNPPQYQSAAASIMIQAAQSKFVTEYQIWQKACEDNSVQDCFEHYSLDVPDDADEFQQLIHTMEKIPIEEDNNHEFYGEIEKHLKRIRSVLEGDKTMHPCRMYDPNKKVKTGIEKVDGEYAPKN